MSTEEERERFRVAFQRAILAYFDKLLEKDAEDADDSDQDSGAVSPE